MVCEWKIPIVGQPNVGKSTFINALLGKYVTEIANWPGATVEVKVIEARIEGKDVCLIDLPGTYSLSSSSEEERVTAEFLLKEQFDNVILLGDSTAPRRTLYLIVQALELLGIGVIALNKYDMALKVGIHINAEALSKKLGKPVFLISAITSEGIYDVIRKALEKQSPKYIEIDYKDLEYYVVHLSQIFSKLELKGNKRWYAVEFLLGNPVVEELIRTLDEEAFSRALEVREKAAKELGDLRKIAIDARLDFINEVLDGVIFKEKVADKETSRVARFLDDVFLHPIAGIVASLALLFGVFAIAFTVNTGYPLNVILSSFGLNGPAEVLENYNLAGMLSSLFDSLSGLVKSALPSPIGPLLVDGVISGVGAVLTFFPLIFTIYLLLALLEDSGIAPRIAVAMDPLFRAIGLNGKAIFPSIVSLGCNVPGVMATRVLKERESRIALALTIPFLPCQARLVVLLALASTLPSPMNSLSLAFVYALSLATFMIVNAVILKLIFKKSEDSLLLELPPYHVPKLRVVSWMAWNNAKHFLRKAGTVILFFSILLWFLTHVSPAGTFVENEAESLAALIGKSLEVIPAVVLETSKDSSWILSFSMFAGSVAKEIVLETLAVLTGTSSVKQMVSALHLSYAQVIGFMVAVALSVPCVATIAAIRSETNSWKLTVASILLSTIISIIEASIVYRFFQVLLG